MEAIDPSSKRLCTRTHAQEEESLFDPRILPEKRFNPNLDFAIPKFLNDLNNSKDITTITFTKLQIKQQLEITLLILHSEEANNYYGERRLWFRQANNLKALTDQFKTFALSLCKQTVKDVLAHLTACQDPYFLVFSGVQSQKKIEDFVPKNRHHIVMVPCEPEECDSSILFSPLNKEIDTESAIHTLQANSPDSIQILIFLSLLNVKKVPVKLVKMLCMEENEAQPLLDYHLITKTGENLYTLDSSLNKPFLLKFLNPAICADYFEKLHGTWKKQPKNTAESKGNEILFYYLKEYVTALEKDPPEELLETLQTSCTTIATLLKGWENEEESQKFEIKASQFIPIKRLTALKEKQEKKLKALGYEQTETRAICAEELGETLFKLKNFQAAQTKYLLAIGLYKASSSKDHPKLTELRKCVDTIQKINNKPNLSKCGRMSSCHTPSSLKRSGSTTSKRSTFS